MQSAALLSEFRLGHLHQQTRNALTLKDLYQKAHLRTSLFQFYHRYTGSAKLDMLIMKRSDTGNG